MIVTAAEIEQLIKWVDWQGTWQGTGLYRARYGVGRANTPWAGQDVFHVVLHPKSGHNTSYDFYVYPPGESPDQMLQTLTKDQESLMSQKAHAYFRNREARRRILAVLFLQATPPFLVTYHGTDARNLPSILEKGLQAQRPGGDPRIDKGVYLTNDMEKAARYAVEGTWSESSRPCILEVRVSKQKRVKKIYRDRLDRDEGNLSDSYDDYGDEEVRALQNAVRGVLGLGHWDRIPRELGFHDFETYGDPAALAGMNLYQPLLAYARKQGWNIQQFKRRLFENLPPGEVFGPWEITDSGTLTLDQDAYDGMHQQVYPQNLPPSTIKAVWLSGVPEGVHGERIKLTSKLLPQEVRRTVDAVQRLGYEYDFHGGLQNSDTHELDRIVTELEDLDGNGWYSDDIAKMRQVIQAVEGGDGDVEAAQEIVADTMSGIIEWVHEYLYDPPGGKTTEFTRLSPQQALQMIQQEVAA